ncbi:nucleotidyl transferase AbiEii/AbiGii toxin family protein [Sphingobacterium sp. KU25419]|nr:nucleotidyl transferase AbiEii/AbiGii toxin family protein [Sphingobacterium sp. KU25419]
MKIGYILLEWMMMHYNTVNIHLKSALNLLMQAPIFDSFRLVGGTSLSLQIGHRLSVDIDLFTDEDYGTIDFDEIDRFLENNFEDVQHTANALPGMGKSYFITDDNLDAAATVKLDVYYSMEKFMQHH